LKQSDGLMAWLKKKSTIVFVIVLLVMVFGAYAYVASQPTAEEILKRQKETELAARQKEFQKTLTWAWTESPGILGFPLIQYAEHRGVAKESYETLVRFEGSSFDFKPCLAEKWEVSPDGKVYTFYLRKGVKFYPSGDPFNAQAVKYSFDYGFNSSVSSAILFGYPGALQYDKCQIVDDYTVKVYIKKPLAWFMQAVAYVQVGGIVNPKFIEAHGGLPKSLGAVDPYLIWHQDVTGPYIVEEFKQGERIVLKRNPTYWMGWTGEMAKRPERIVVLTVPETATRLMLIGRGDADLAYIEPIYLPELKRRIASEKLPLVIDEGSTGRLLHIAFDFKNPPTNDVHIRRALAWSFNYDQYIEKIMYGFGVRQITWVTKGFWGYQTDVPYYTFNLDKAKQELALAAPENRAMVEKGIKITYALGYAIGKEGLMMWKSDLVKIGVNLILDEVPTATFRSQQRVGGVPIMDAAWTPDFNDPATFYNMLYTTYWKNLAFGQSPSWVDGVMDQAAAATDPNQRLKLYRQIEEWSYEDAPFLKVAGVTAGGMYNVRGTWVKGYEYHPMLAGKPMLWELWKELPMERGATTSAAHVLSLAPTLTIRYRSQRNLKK